MDSKEALLLAKYQEEKSQARQHENHRVSITNVILTISAVAFALLGTDYGRVSNNQKVNEFIRF